ncbi:arginase family hydrolase, arginase/agmainase/formiminoglutamate hydrolase [Flavobacterium enshiense DK69]|uniref:Arginase n=1 Tax=Flavobacterium enshiense DK69 TaxID=1107311 RepID=V6SDL6_9FLAO|nr:formimidoylglutamase [Flavobacterium enshiense]ESU24768.1 arginase family hydrolase, arginase/agmainase/formiminoglutamate hydrolase [Flavobacterium enshiense DK69]KGO96778.1 arginase [Flavobacterium enshiense DK69]
MEKLIRFTVSDLTKITNHRNTEIKFGERIQTVPKEMDIIEFLKTSPAEFVLLGIPEDIGVRANLGRQGTASAWESAVKSLVNIQNNKFCKGSRVILLGTLNVKEEMEAAANLDITNKDDKKVFFKLIDKIDKEVSHIICQIVKAGKNPIVIGGGHNNAYGNIKGLALAKGKPVNAINFDAHTDFRALEGRHSGNGFSYAYEEGFLKKYFIFGLHESYTSKSILESIKRTEDKIKFNTYEEIAVRKEKNFETEMELGQKHIGSEPFGIEIDLDAVPNIPSSAMTLSGFSVEQLRQFLHYFGQNPNASYLHICEGAPDLDFDKNNHLVGKLIAYLITDFMKAKSDK